MKRSLLFSAGLFCLTFTQAQSTVTQSSKADFATGTFVSNTTTLADAGGGADNVVGQVTITPSFADDGNYVNIGWNESSYQAGQVGVWTGNEIYLDGVDEVSKTSIANSALKPASIEFRAIFPNSPYTNIGITTSSSGQFGAPWVAIGKGLGGGTQLYARYSPDNISAPTEVALPNGIADGQFHLYKIVWNTDGTFNFYVDGVLQVITFTPTIAAGTSAWVDMSEYGPGAGAGAADGNILVTDWIKATDASTASTGSYTSKVFSVQESVSTWGHINWSAQLPAGTDLAISVRTGNTPTPDGSWSSFTAVANGANMSTAFPISIPDGKYIQYAAAFITSNTSVMPTMLDITIESSNAQLPVSFTSLTASAIGNNVKLDWSTISESNNKGFDVMRSTDGVKWSPLGFVAGAGNSAVKNTYTYSDANLNAGLYYYRLRQVDFDGKSALTNIVTANVTAKPITSLGQNYPNPLRGNTVIKYSVSQNAHVRITVYDLNGRVVKVAEDVQRKAGNYTFVLDASMMNSGIYYYKMEANGYTATRKMVVQN
jgi:hypothetical protein